MLSNLARPLARCRALCAPASRRSASGSPHYNEPSGWLFGEKPPPPGQKRQKESWENIWYWGMYGGMGFAIVGHYFKPDTSIQTWALKEAKARMIARGEEVEYKPRNTS